MCVSIITNSLVLFDDLYHDNLCAQCPQLILQRKLGLAVEEENTVEEEPEKEEEDGEKEAPTDSSRLKQSRTDSDTPTPNSSLEAPSVGLASSTSSSRTAKHSKLTKAVSLRSQGSGDNGYNTPTGGERRVGSFRRVLSGTRPNTKIGPHSHQGSDSSMGKGSSGGRILRVGSGSLDAQRRKASMTVLRTVSMGYESDDEGNVYYSTSRPEWGFDQIAMQSDSDSDLEFFDAKGQCTCNP